MTIFYGPTTFFLKTVVGTALSEMTDSFVLIWSKSFNSSIGFPLATTSSSDWKLSLEKSISFEPKFYSILVHFLLLSCFYFSKKVTCWISQWTTPRLPSRRSCFDFFRFITSYLMHAANSGLKTVYAARGLSEKKSILSLYLLKFAWLKRCSLAVHHFAYLKRYWMARHSDSNYRKF